MTIIQERAMEELKRTRELISEVAKISTPEDHPNILTEKGIEWVKTKIQVIKDVHTKGYIYGIKRLSNETGMGVPEAARIICGWFGVSPADSWLDKHDFAAKSGAALIKQHCKGVAVMPEIVLDKLFSIHERTLNFDKWQPKEEDKPRIVAELHDCYIGTLSNCGLGEESEEARKFYEHVRDTSIQDCKDDIQEFFHDCYDAVQGRIDELYSEETVYLINLTVCPE